MTAQTTDVYPENVRPDYTDDEIDLRAYLLVLLRWWREILAITVLASLLTGIVLVVLDSIRTPTYAANADIVIARLSSSVELDARINTTSNSTVPVDPNAWRTSLLQLVKSSVVAGQVIEELGDELPEGLQSPEVLLRIVSGEIPLSPDGRTASNLIRIRAVTIDPELSAKIANSWARHLVTYINGLYGEVPEVMIDSVVAERDEALQTYQTAQKALEAFISNNQLDSIDRQINEKVTLRNGLMANYTHMVTSVVNSDYNARLSLYNAVVTVPAAHTWEILSTQMDANVKTLNLLYSLRDSATTQLNQALNMERSLMEGGEAAAKSNTTALQLLKLAVFSSMSNTERLPANLSFVDPAPGTAMSLEEQLTDVRALITVLEDYTASLDSDIATLTEAEGAGVDPSILASAESHFNSQRQIAGSGVYSDVASIYAQLLAVDNMTERLPAEVSSAFAENYTTVITQVEEELRALRSARSAEEARQRQLIHQRDQAWTTYETVVAKLQELNLLRSSANSEVRLGNPALPPNEPLLQSELLIPVAAATVAGFLFAVILALVANSLGSPPFFARRPV